MATAKEIGHHDTEFQFRICCLCNAELKKPKLMPCYHSFCTRCLKKHHGDLGKGVPFCCPTCQCQNNFEYGDDQVLVDWLPDNFLFDTLKEADIKAFREGLKCIPCSKEVKAVDATHICIDCNDTLCQHCNDLHCRYTSTRHHEVMAIGDMQEDDLAKERPFYCQWHALSKHRKGPPSRYCKKCECLVCNDCIEVEARHLEHTCIEMQAAREIQQKLFEENALKLQRPKQDQEKRIVNIRRVITDTKQKWNEQETEVHETATEIHAMVDKIKDDKLTELKTHYEKELEHLDNILEEEKHKLRGLQGTMVFTKMFQEKSSDVDFLYHEGDINDKIEESQKGLSYRFKRNLLTIEKTEIESIRVTLEDVLGRIKVEGKVVQHQCRIGEVEERFRKKIDVTEMYGITCDKTRDNEILVIGEDGILKLYENGCCRSHIERRHDSFDIQMTNSHMILADDGYERKVVFSDPYGKMIKSVLMPEDDHDALFSCDGELGSTFRLVADSEGTIFISSGSMNRIYRLGPTDDKMSIFVSEETSDDLSSPSYLCLAPCGELVVSQECGSSFLVYSKYGELQWKYTGEEEGNALRGIEGICCDEDGYIYVVDRWNSRIQVIHDRKWVGNIPIDEEVGGYCFNVPLVSTPSKELIYGYKDILVKIAFWEIE